MVSHPSGVEYDAGPMAVVTETLEVEGIRCERCVQRLAVALGGVDGLAGASANADGRRHARVRRRRTCEPRPSRRSRPRVSPLPERRRAVDRRRVSHAVRPLRRRAVHACGPTISRRSSSAEAVRRAGCDVDDIEDVILGAANQSGEDNRDVGRMAALLAGLPVARRRADGQPAVRIRACRRSSRPHTRSRPAPATCSSRAASSR